MTPTETLTLATYFFVLIILAVYGWHRYYLVYLYMKNKGRQPVPLGSFDSPPRITVQLPIYNEMYVADRLIDAVCQLDYPRDLLEIQVLDDSTDETTSVAERAVRRNAAAGIAITYLHRADRTGYKAGALEAGLRVATGEYVAIFDADFMPTPDFLQRTVPFFTDPKVAMVQARWGHINQDYSLLTKIQSILLDGHFVLEHGGRNRSGLFFNFNGTAGIWRRSAIADAGGWQHDTLTEDLDLSYRAQLRGWRIVYRPDLVCPAELPVVITGFKSQQRRWAKGSIQTALKLLPAILRARLSPWTKYQAFVHLTYYMIHPAMLTVALLSVPLLWAEGLAPEGSVLLAVSLTFSLGFLGPGLLLVYAQHVLDPGWRRRVWRLPTIMIIGVGVAWSTSLAVLGAFWRKDLEFVRTPKFGIGPAGGHWRGKAYRDRRPGGGLIEIALGLYCAWSAWLFWVHQSYSALPFLALYTSGFLTVGVLTIRHAMLGAGDRSRGGDDAAAPG